MIIPTIIEKHSNKEYAYDIYSRLLQDRIILLNGEINDSTANVVVAELLYLDSLNNDDICIYIKNVFLCQRFKAFSMSVLILSVIFLAAMGTGRSA